MKPVYYIFLILLVYVSSCDSRKQRTSQTSDSTAATKLTTDNTPKPLTDRLIRLGLTTNSHWRGLNLGDDFSAVKTKEQGKPFEQDARHMGYAVEFPNLESMDVLYEQQSGKISAIVADLYLNNRPTVNAYQKDLSDYFTAHYGNPKTVNGGSVWISPANEQVALTDVSKGKDYGLNVRITSTRGATASAR